MPEVQEFLAAAKRLGEPIVNGFRDVDRFSGAWTLESTVAASEIAGVSDPIHTDYLFSVLRPANDSCTSYKEPKWAKSGERG